MTSSGPVLNIASTASGVRTLGPGVRSVVWVQGCPIHCNGCIAPDWIPFRPNQLLTPAEVARLLLSDPTLNGITISGGEPMMQAAGLAEMLKICRQIREIDVICFTGYRLEKLLTGKEFYGVTDLLDQVDVLIDGPYLSNQNDNIGLRGSKNQRFHHLTDRLAWFDFEQAPRSMDVQISPEGLILAGIPTREFAKSLDAIPQPDCQITGGAYERV
jgi:anaerobic ribonucleoside-triphosphate reductase activating protein